MNQKVSLDADPFRIGITSPVNLTALQAVLSAAQAIWSEAALGTPAPGEAAVILIPKTSFHNGGRIVPQEAAEGIRAQSLSEEDALAHQTNITIMAPDAVEAVPPQEALNLLSGYCHGLLESLPEGSNAVQQTIHIPGRDEPYVLSIQPKSQAVRPAPAEWADGAGWEKRETPVTATAGDARRRQLLQRLSSMEAVQRVLGRTMKNQVQEALRAD